MKEELLKGLTKEQIAKVKACKSQEEVLALAKEEGIELSDEQLEAVSGGCSAPQNEPCPKCRSINTVDDCSGVFVAWTCKDCGHKWGGYPD